jgi:nuclear cap-binding protein subunit 2
VKFHHRIDALNAVVSLTGTKFDGMLIRVELDAGFKPGRQYGRGTSGGQVRDVCGEERRRKWSKAAGAGGDGTCSLRNPAGLWVGWWMSE